MFTYQIKYCPWVVACHRLRSFQSHFSQLLGLQNSFYSIGTTSVFVLHQNASSNYSIRVCCFLLLKPSFLCISSITIANGKKTRRVNWLFQNRLNSIFGTLGARGFSCAVSGCSCDPREKRQAARCVGLRPISPDVSEEKTSGTQGTFSDTSAKPVIAPYKIIM